MRSSILNLTASIDTLVADDLTDWTDTQVRDGLLALLPVVNQLGTLVSDLARTFDRRNLSTQDGFRTARSWLTAFGRLTPAAASGYLSRAWLLAHLPALAAAARAGTVSADHLRKVNALVEHVGIEAVLDFDKILATLAASANPADLGAACERIRAHLDPDGADPDPDAARRRSLHIRRVGSLFAVRGFLDAEGGAVVLTALDALMRPPTPEDTRDMGQRFADALVDLARIGLISGELPLVGGVRPQLGLLLTPEALLGDETLPDDEALPGDDKPVDDLPGDDLPGDDESSDDEASDDEAGDHEPCATAAAAAGRTDAGRPGTGPANGKPLPDDVLGRAGVPMPPEPPWASWKARLPAAIARRIACDCEVWRVVLDPATGLPLEVGRTHRIVPHWIRKALHARDQGCRWPGCTVPAAWTEVHHLIAWYVGGPTNIDNCLLLCRFHHGLVHEGRSPAQRWRIRLDPANGAVYVYRPDGTPYELGPGQPYRGPARPASDGVASARRRGDPAISRLTR